MPPVVPTEPSSLASRTRRILGWGFFALGVLAIGGCVAENYRGHYLWKKYREKWEAKGERFDLASFIPKPVPPEQNFAATPFFAPFLDYAIDETNRGASRRQCPAVLSFPSHYNEYYYALLPHLASLKGLARIVQLRTVAHLQAGHSAEALQDAQLCLRLADSLKSEGFLISQLVRIRSM